MKFTENTTETVSSIGVKPRPLQVHNAVDAAVMSKILTESLYSDPERTVLAEYASNAWDAHVKAGNTDTPIEITLPSKWGSHDLIFRDYGCGMTAEEADYHFIGLGASSKRDENKSIGGFGIGCKSGYAIDGVEGFTIVSVKDGQRTIVIMGKDENGQPAVLSEPTSVATDQPNGTVVTIPIPVESIDILNSKVEEHFSTWEPGRVLVDGEEPVSIYNSGEFRQVGEHGWISLERGSTDYYRSSSTLNVISGGNAYKINLSGNDINEICGSYAYLATGYNPFTVYLNTGIGEVDLSANRADVRLKRSTREVLKNRYKAFAETLIAEVQDKMNDATNEAEALVAAAGVTKYVRAEDVKWRGDKVPAEVNVQGAGYTYEDGKRSRSYNTTGERSTISLPVAVKEEGHISKFYVMDTTNTEAGDATILGHLTTYIKTEEFDGPNRFRVYFINKDDRANPWVDGAITNGTLDTLDAAEVIEVSKAERKRVRATGRTGTGARDTMTYPYMVKENGRMVISELTITELREVVEAAGNVVVLQEEKWGGLDTATAVRYPDLFTEDDIVVVSKVNRKSDVLIKRLNLDTYKTFRGHAREVVESKLDNAAANEAEINIRVLNNAHQLRTILQDMRHYADQNGVTIDNADIVALMDAAAAPERSCNDNDPMRMAQKLSLSSTVINDHAEAVKDAYKARVEKLAAEHPLLMNLAGRWGWNSSLAGDLVTLVNAKA